MANTKLKYRSIWVLLLFCTATGVWAQSNANQTYLPAELDINGLTFKIDPRIELLYSVGYIVGYPFMNGLDIQYKQDVEHAFSGYRDHEVLSFWKEIGPKGFALDVPVFCVIRQMENLQQSEPANTENDQQKFIRLLKQFAVESDFQSFFNSHQDFYRLILENIEFNFRDYHEVERLEHYFGQKQNSYTIIINLMGSGNFAPRVETPSGLDIYCVMEPQAKCGNIPGFDIPRRFDELVWHEFAHSFVNPLADEYKDQINQYAHLYGPIQSSMTSQAYSNWLVTVKEHIVRAVTIRLMEDKYGPDITFHSTFKMEMGKRFIYVKPLCEKLKEYETNRSQYPSFEEFFPELIGVFKHISEKNIADYQSCVEQYRKPNVEKIPKPVNGYDHTSTLIIKPTAEKDASVQQKLHEFIERYRRQLNSKFRVVTDKQALKLDLTQYDLIVFGTPEGNLLLRKYLDHLPLAVQSDSITANRTYEGDDYQLITGWTNPLNPNRKMTIFTAQKPQMLININQVPYGGTHYVIAKNYMPVKQGNYTRHMKIWACE